MRDWEPEGLTESRPVMAPLHLVLLICERLKGPLRLPANPALNESENEEACLWGGWEDRNGA